MRSIRRGQVHRPQDTASPPRAGRLRGSGRRRSVRAKPGGVIKEYRFGLGRSAPRGWWTKAPGARGFNPLPNSASGGRRGSDPDRTARAISARAWGVPEPAAERLVPSPAQGARLPWRDRPHPANQAPGAPRRRPPGRSPLNRPHHASGRRPTPSPVMERGPVWGRSGGGRTGFQS